MMFLPRKPQCVGGPGISLRCCLRINFAHLARYLEHTPSCRELNVSRVNIHLPALKGDQREHQVQRGKNVRIDCVAVLKV